MRLLQASMHDRRQCVHKIMQVRFDNDNDINNNNDDIKDEPQLKRIITDLTE